MFSIDTDEFEIDLFAEPDERISRTESRVPPSGRRRNAIRIMQIADRAFEIGRGVNDMIDQGASARLGRTVSPA